MEAETIERIALVLFRQSTGLTIASFSELPGIHAEAWRDQAREVLEAMPEPAI